MQAVFHLAALIAIPYSYVAPSSYIETNVNGTLNVLQAARNTGIERLIVTSTSEVYGTAKFVPINETHPRQGQSPYSASKIAADSLTESFIKSFELPATIVRPFNTFGPRQSARAIIPTLITQLLSGTTDLQMGSLSPTRDFNFVSDTVRGFIEISNSVQTVGAELNIATGEEISMEDLAKKLIKIINPGARIVFDQQRLRPENSEVNRLLGDKSKISSLTNWKQEVGFDQGLAMTVEWFKDPKNLARYTNSRYSI